MKTKLYGWVRTGWRALTEVPGWPDAPLSARLKRALPVLIPCTAMVLLLDWNLSMEVPKVHDQEVALAPLRRLETEVAELRMRCSQQVAKDAAEGSAAARRLLLASPGDALAVLESLKQEAAAQGWDATFVTSDPDPARPANGAALAFLPVKGRLLPHAGNSEIFASFLRVMERFSVSRKRIDLVRLAIRADEQHWQAVELNFRLVYPWHEKTPQ